ncbi:hypothetical protein BLOT_016197 [Blomia tropicalis]|nr:hypothetical protein BLOT_016197 [Blomia tropicalis]
MFDDGTLINIPGPRQVSDGSSLNVVATHECHTRALSPHGDQRVELAHKCPPRGGIHVMNTRPKRKAAVDALATIEKLFGSTKATRVAPGPNIYASVRGN